ncbi:MAG: hypothetical protein N4A68_11805 [Maledivibacter sp.]|nr:hypothetical protein [Maledivibacter sp.]
MMKIIKKNKAKVDEIEIKQATILLAVCDENLRKSLTDILSKIEGVTINGEVADTKQMLEVISREDNNNLDIIVLSTDIPSHESLMYVTKRIPREIRILALDTARINKLIYGKLQEDGVEFIEELEELEKYIFLEEIDEDDEGLEKVKKKKDKNAEKKPREPNNEKKVVKRKRGKNYTITDLIKNQKVDSNTQLKEVVRSVETTKHAVIKKEKIIYRHPKDYKKTIALFSPMSTGKTELASNIAKSLGDKGKKVILMDLDFEKYGQLYNFKIPSGERCENFFKYRLLFKKTEEYLSSECNFEFTDKTIEDLAAHREKNLLVFTGHIEVPIKDKNEINKMSSEILTEPILRSLKLNTFEAKAIKESYIENKIMIEPDTLAYIIKKFKSLGDVVVIDVGKNLPYDLMKVIMDIDNLEKILVTTQNIEHLNSIPCLFRLKHDVDFDDWTIVTNMHRKIKGLKDEGIRRYFEDSEGLEKKFKIKDQFMVPYNAAATAHKANRECIYGKDEDFDNAIDNIINTCLGIQRYKEGMVSGFLGKLRKGSWL